tara:strand:+ start:108 stop:1265 length:1158 start_codon:yes stop_codon:yes gene_type:complete
MQIDSPKIDNVLENAAQQKVPAVSAAVISKDEDLYKGNFGFKDLENKDPVDDNTLFRIASMTKAITSTCIYQLIDKDILSLDTNLKDYFPEISDKKVIRGFDDNGDPILSDVSIDINIGHLLTHTSGFAYEIWNESIAKLVEKGDLQTAFANNDEFLKAPLVFEPGSDWEYGIGIDWLGVLIEKINECSLQEYMHTHIFEPLGMSNTSYDLDKSKHSRVAKVYGRNGDEYFEMPFEVPEKSSFYSGGGNLISSLDDYSKFLKIFLNSGKGSQEQILSESSISSMLCSLNEELVMKKMLTQVPMLSNDVDFFPTSTKSWSPGFMVNHEDIRSGRPKNSSGWAGLFNSFFWIDPKNEIAALILMQMLPFSEEGCFTTLQEFEGSIYS